MNSGAPLALATRCRRKSRGRLLTFSFLFLLIMQSFAKTARTLRFEEWLDEQKVLVDGVEIVEATAATGVRGVQSVRALRNGHQVAKIPLTAMLNIEHALVNEEIGSLLNEHMWVNDLFGMALLLHRLNKSQTKWGSYLEWIPHVNETKPGRQYPRNATVAIKAEWTKRRNFNKALLGRLRAARPVLFRDLTLERLEHYVFIVQSRAFGIQAMDVKGEWHNAKCLVPFADAFNTGKHVNVACFTNSASSHFVCKTTRDVAPGEELLVPYKSQSEVSFALSYGFSLADASGSTDGMGRGDL